MKKIALQDKAYEILKERIVSCEYRPGMLLNIVSLQKDLGFSRTPIREAVGRLEQENLIRVIPKKGLVVRDLDGATVRDIFETRMVLEPYLIRTYGGKLDSAGLRACRQRFVWKDIAPETKAHFYRYDDEFHAVITGACPNIYLTQSLDRITLQNHRVRVLSGSVLHRLEATCREHIAIIDALLDGDLARAAEAMTAHLTNARRAAFSLLLQAEAPHGASGGVTSR